jgi:hypothetical protein
MDPPARASAHARPQAQRRADPVKARPAGSRAYEPQGKSTGVADVGVLDPQKILSLQRAAGNRAVTALLEGSRYLAPRRSPARGEGDGYLQRKVGWSDASKEGKGWNVGQQEVGQIHRIPLEGLKQGLQQESARRWVKATGKVKGHFVDESTLLPGLSSESAKGKAIVLVPAGLDPTQPIEILIQLHGYTESAGRPFAGWRELNPKTKGNKKLQTLRHGLDEKDVAPVRDVALDQAEQQLEESGYKQTVIVLPQGGLHSQFGKKGDTNFDSGAYSNEIVKRLFDEKVWKNATKVPEIGRVSMAGHSGAGATLANMARESVRQAAKPGAQGAGSSLTGDLVLFDAINPGELSAFKDWALMRLNTDLAALKIRGGADKLTYLKTAPKLRGYYSTKPDVGYVDPYTKLDGAIGNWFSDNAAILGSMAAPLRSNFTVVPVAVAHEELMRGVAASEDRKKGSGDILDALRALHGDLKPAAAKPTGTVDSSKPASSTKPASKVKPAHAPKAATPASAAESRAKYIATAILLAKTGGEGAGETEEQRKAAKEAAEASVKRDIEKGTKKDIDAWFQGLEPDATFLGLRIHRSSPDEPPGVHHELAVKLTAAEASLVNTKAGEKPLEAAARLGVKDISGMRVPKTPTGKTSGASMHCFGLAVDIDHDNNPFVGNKDKPEKAGRGGGPSLQIIQHATLLLAGAPRDVRREPPELKGKPKTDSEADRAARAARAGEQWKLLHADSELVRQYLSMSPEELDRALKEHLPALKAWKDALTAQPPAAASSKKKKKKRASPPAWVEHVTEPDWWHDAQKRDRKQSMKGDFGRGKTSDPTKFGFMTLHEEVVKALVGAGLSWGGTYNGDKDIMHFDLRTGSIGGRPVV